MKVKLFECDHCCLPKLKKEMLPLIEGVQTQEHENGDRRQPREIVDYGAIIDTAIPCLTKDV